MQSFGRRIYYDKTSGLVILDTGERQGGLPITIEKEIEIYKVLSERNAESFDVIELEYGEFRQDIGESVGMVVNLGTETLEFSYPDPNEPDVEQQYQAPLSEQLDELEANFMYDSMMKDMAIEESNNQQAELMYQLMMNGVL